MEKIKTIAIDNGYQIKLINRLIQHTIDKMSKDTSKNKTVSEVNIKRAVLNYYQSFFEYVKSIPFKKCWLFHSEALFKVKDALKHQNQFY